MQVIAAVEGDKQPAKIEPAGGLRRVARALWQPHPQDIDRRAKGLDLEPSLLAHDRMPAVGADDEGGAQLERARTALAADPDDPPAILDEAAHLGLHQEMKPGIAAGALGEKIEEIPLR